MNDLLGRCYVSGRDPRIWGNEDRYNDLIESIISLTSTGPSSSLLEVGCATGFLTVGLAGKLHEYVGVDIAPEAVRVAKSLRIENCSFDVSDGDDLPFPDNRFDASILYDVVTNFPTLSEIAPIIKEMDRVTRVGGVVLIGSIPNEHFQDEDRKTALDLDSLLSSIPFDATTSRRSARKTFRRRWLRRVEPGIVGYYFRPEDFESLGTDLGLHTRIEPIHGLNPYVRSRFNVVYHR